VIVLTTFNLDDRAATAIRHGASGFLLKDTTPLMLRDAIRTVHGGNAVLAPQDLATLLDRQFQAQGRAAAGVPRAHRQGTRGLHRGGPRSVQCGDRRHRVRQRVHGQNPCRRHPAQAGLRDRVQIVVFATSTVLPDLGSRRSRVLSGEFRSGPRPRVVSTNLGGCFGTIRRVSCTAAYHEEPTP
jgi:hypothetical protein